MDDPERIRLERVLKDAVLAGDADAWRVWFERSQPALWAYALWRCGNARDAAEEIVGEVWLVAVRRLSAFDPGQGPFLAWLRGIAAGLANNRFRKDARRAVLAPVRSFTAEPADAEAMRRERSLIVARTLASLPDRYEAVLRMRYLEGLSVPEIAGLRGESAKAVESALSRAREAFKDLFPAAERLP